MQTNYITTSQYPQTANTIYPPPNYEKSNLSVQQQGVVPQAQFQQQPTVITHTTVSSQSATSGLRTAIPELPMVLAVILCVVNIFFPGIGTVIAGFSVLCCGNVGQSGGGRFGTFCINFWVGLLQLFLVIFIVGWVWSIMWGVAFIALSAEANQKKTSTTTTTITTGGVNPQSIPMSTTVPVQTPTYNV